MSKVLPEIETHYQTFLEKNPVPRFYGDEPLSVYLERFCNSAAKDGGKTELILVENLRISYNHNKMQIPQSKTLTKTPETFKNKINCHFVYYHNVTLKELDAQIDSNLHFKYKKLQIIFNFESFYFGNDKEYFNFTIISMCQLYFNCQACLPFIAIFNRQLTMQKMKNWANISVSHITDYFQAVLLINSNGLSAISPSIVYLNPILNGCHLRSKHLFVPKTSQDFASLKTHYSHCNFNQAVIRVSVNSDFPYCLLNIDPKKGNITTDYSIDIELLKVMMDKYNFSVRYIDGNNSWGALDENGSWVGVIGHILSGKSNMAICEVGRTEKRLEVVDFTTYTFLDQLVFISRSPTKEHTDLLFTDRMSTRLKFFQGASYLLVLLTLTIIYKVHQKLSNNNLPTKLLAVFLKQCR